MFGSSLASPRPHLGARGYFTLNPRTMALVFILYLAFLILFFAFSENK